MIENRVSEVMGRKRVKVSELAEQAGVSRSTVHKLYHERTDYISFPVLDKLCRALEVDVADLFRYVPDSDQETGR